jgi:hypothetical protein
MCFVNKHVIKVGLCKCLHNGVSCIINGIPAQRPFNYEMAIESLTPCRYNDDKVT